MKKIFSTLMIVASGCLFLGSCNHNNPTPNAPNEIPIRDEYIVTTHLINWYRTLSGIGVAEDIVYPQEDGTYRVALTYTFSEEFVYGRDSRQTQRIHEIAQKIGDTGSSYRMMEEAPSQISHTPQIKSLDIYSQEGFDSQHAAQASINDLVLLDYYSDYPFIKNNYSAQGLHNTIAPELDKATVHISKTPQEITPNEWSLVALDSYDDRASNVLYYVVFKKAPRADASVQHLTFTITTENGILTTSKAIAFMPKA